MKTARRWMCRSWPFALCVATAGVTFVCMRLSDRKQDLDGGKVMVEHVSVKSEKPFGEVCAAFEAQLGKFDSAIYEQLRTGADPETVRPRLDGMVGPSGFMLFRTSDHGALLRLAGQNKKAIQYLVGNPLFAIQMTQHDIRAGLYAPLGSPFFGEKQVFPPTANCQAAGACPGRQGQEPNARLV
jgi:hypothetical protein